MNLQCINSEWLPERQSLKLIPDCERNNLSADAFMCWLNFWCFQRSANRLAWMVATAYPTTSVSAWRISGDRNVSGEQIDVQRRSWTSTVVCPARVLLIHSTASWFVPKTFHLSLRQRMFIHAAMQLDNLFPSRFRDVFLVKFWTFLKALSLRSLGSFYYELFTELGTLLPIILLKSFKSFNQHYWKLFSRTLKAHLKSFENSNLKALKALIKSF